MPASLPVSPCSHTAAAAASKPAMPCARRPATKPARTSPEPAVASRGRAFSAIGAAVQCGHDRVGALEHHDGAGGARRQRARFQFEFTIDVLDRLEQACEFALVRGQDRAGIGTRAGCRSERHRGLGEARQGIGIKTTAGPAASARAEGCAWPARRRRPAPAPPRCDASARKSTSAWHRRPGGPRPRGWSRH